MNIFDNGLNASMMTAVLFENLVLIDSMRAEEDIDIIGRIKKFIHDLS